MAMQALTGATLVFPDRELADHALILRSGVIEGWVDDSAIPAACEIVDLGGGYLAPGFIDTQVNGGGDVLFNDHPTVAGIRAIATAHRRFGTTGLLPTLISDEPDVVDQAIQAAEAALEQGVPGVLGVHIEGPHLNLAKKGIHDSEKFTVMDQVALDRLSRPSRGRRLVTLAPELAPAGAIRALTDAGVIVAAGHSMADYDTVRLAQSEGLAGFTHLFNAMTPLESREPGMVGAALEDRRTFFGMIVDGAHVHPATLKIALAARGLGGAMLVTDAMPPVGGSRSSFTLMGVDITVVDGVCRGPDGTLAGSALSMAQAVRNAVRMLDCSLVEASRLASGNPAAFLGLRSRTGAIAKGLRADLVHLDAQLQVKQTWIAGQLSEEGECILIDDAPTGAARDYGQGRNRPQSSPREAALERGAD